MRGIILQNLKDRIAIFPGSRARHDGLDTCRNRLESDLYLGQIFLCILIRSVTF
jgi:hypothetical protein